MHSALKVGLVLPAVALMVSGCVATRNWVTEHVNKKEVEIDQKIGGVDSKVAAQSQRVDGVDTRLKTAEGGLVETGQLAKGARERADGAFTKADDVDGRLTRLWSNRNVRDLVETQQVLFGFDKWELNDNAQTALTSLVKEMKENVRLTVDLEGYADPTGSYGYNVGLSQRRVEAVRRFLVEKGVELPRIHLVGLGPITEKGTPNDQKRRVTVKLMVSKDN
jgi:outer membrane protein OmpA-like peptidoglycan-associated protein